ncbi:MAG: 8-oxo-dGTP diphosphatase MutT [Deltaproteobacteria bacterium]|nr:8-oxo-dGTP diphosphatase MutT [Deltaproteobacteria bacterium]
MVIMQEKGKPHFQVAAGLLRRDCRVLVTKRPEGKHLAGFWEFPGGKQERGETLEACLEREMKEELGIEVQVGKHLYTVHHEYEDRRVSLHLFLCIDLGGDPKPLDSQEIKWVSHEDLPQYQFSPPDLKILKLLSDFE